MKRVLAIVFLNVVGCSSPGFLGQPQKDIEVGGSLFRVYMRSGTEQVEVHRISIEPLPSKSLTLRNAARAIEIATGCSLDDGSLEGDQAIINAEVDCILP